MSLILDALKRAERERQPGAGGTLEDLPGARPPQRRRWIRRSALAVLALVAIAVTVSVVRRPRPAAPAPVEQARAPAPAPQPRPQPQAQPQAQAQPEAAPPSSVSPAPAPSGSIGARPVPSVIPGTEGVSTLDELTPETDVDLEPAAPPPAAEPSTRMPPVDAPARAAQPADEPAAEAAAPEPPAPTSRPQAAPAEGGRPAIPPALTQKAPVRKLREMPPDYRADFPALTLEVHVFEANRRFVMINGRRYKEGERIAEGPQILEIVRDGVVFEYRGEKVLFPLGR